MNAIKTLLQFCLVAVSCQWSVFAGEEVGLRASKSPLGLELAWPLAGTNYFVESSASVGSLVHWDVVTNAPLSGADALRIVLASNDPARFYRLRAWDVLFDGVSTAGFHGIGSTVFPSGSWKLSGNELQNIVGVAQPTSLVSFAIFHGFELTLEWAAGTANANSGVYFRCSESPSPYVDIEYQLLNDAGYPTAVPRQRMGAVYGVLAPHDVSAKPVGQFNEIRLVAIGTQIEHWLNGKQILSYDTSSASFRQAVAVSELAAMGSMANYGRADHGVFLLQYHNGQSRFRNIRVRSF